MMDGEDWAVTRIKELSTSGEDVGAVVGFVKQTLGFHPLGPFSSTIGPMLVVVIRSDGKMERQPDKL